jgi:hypothetical protein
MRCYRLSKYNPIYRNSDGTYGKSEWTSISDIGEQFDDGFFDLKMYLKTENLYVATIVQFFTIANVNEFKLLEFEQSEERFDSLTNTDNSAISKLICETGLSRGKTLDLEQLQTLIRASLREFVWCKIQGQLDTYLHFGYDYYVYLGGEIENSSLWDIPDGLFLEEMTSPYFSG